MLANGDAIVLAKEYPVIKWSDAVGEKFANRYLSQDYNAKAAGTSNGTWASQTAHSWIGRGLKQVTHVNNYADFFVTPKLLQVMHKRGSY